MYMKYICKKPFFINNIIDIKYGNVVNVSFDSICPQIISIYNSDGRELEINPGLAIRDGELKNHFYLYDDIESLDARTTLKYFNFKFRDIDSNDLCKELQLLKQVGYYIHARKQFIKSCIKKEDTQSEQSSTETLHTTNQ